MRRGRDRRRLMGEREGRGAKRRRRCMRLWLLTLPKPRQIKVNASLRLNPLVRSVGPSSSAAVHRDI